MADPCPAHPGRNRAWTPDHLPPPRRRGRDPLPRPAGCQWDALPADFAHHKFVYHYFKTWARDGTLNRMHNAGWCAGFAHHPITARCCTPVQWRCLPGSNW
ncbi:transposase [Micromonospora sp. CPCC 206061]|uniref:transposase n=1 Tax=Micromonospora sp. CPCC 206061 TaxID=3122410 RepID=UPI003FA5D03C